MNRNATRILAGRRESDLLALPSVRRMTDVLSQRCRESSWVRTSVASLERFRAMTGYADLEALREQALAEPELAEQALARFAVALAAYSDIQVSALAMGAKLWFRLNGIAVPWRPLGGTRSAALLPATDAQGAERVILLALIGSGLRLTELLRLRIGDIGSLDGEGHLIPDSEADPLAVQFTPRRGNQVQRLTFLTYQARQALRASLEHAPTVGGSQPLALDAPLLTQADGSPATNASVTRARRRSQALIRAGSEVNVTLCRTTGDFFREWGLPGSRFVGPEELPMEEYL
jgi:integrase